MGYCRNCGTPADNDQPYCYECGSALIVREDPAGFAATPPAQPYQPTQQIPSLQNQVQSPHAQTAQNNTATIDKEKDLFYVKPRKRIPRFAVVLIAILVLFGISSGTFFLLTNNEEALDTQNMPQTTNQTTENTPFEQDIRSNEPEGDVPENDSDPQSAADSSQEQTATEDGMDSASIEKRLNSDTGYLIPTSNTEKLSEEDLESFTDYQLYLAYNEIYARHGRRFPNDDLRQYFSSKSWYSPTYSPEEYDLRGDSLSEIETSNAETIRQLEQTRRSIYLTQ